MTGISLVTVASTSKKMVSEVEMDRKPTRATAASHPNYTAVTQELNQTNNNYIYLILVLLGFLFL